MEHVESDNLPPDVARYYHSTMTALHCMSMGLRYLDVPGRAANAAELVNTLGLETLRGAVVEMRLLKEYLSNWMI